VLDKIRALFVDQFVGMHGISDGTSCPYLSAAAIPGEVIETICVLRSLYILERERTVSLLPVTL
jgi:hypothetical protein